MMGIWLSNLRRLAAQFFIGGSGLALLTFICFQDGLDVSTVGFAYLIVLALVSLMGSFVASGLLTIAAAGLLASRSSRSKGFLMWRERHSP